MASVTVISHLTFEEQAERLREFVGARGGELPSAAALAISKALQLNRATSSNVASKRIKDALAAHDIHVGRSVACEALARLCGSSNWMRTRQLMLALGNPVEGPMTELPICYCLHVTRHDGVAGDLVVKAAFTELAPVILDVMRKEWPSDVAPALCTIAVGCKVAQLQFEHGNAPWLDLRIWSFRAHAEDSEEKLPQLEDLPSAYVHDLVDKLERALEYAHPGTLVLGATRNRQLAAQYLLMPTVTMDATGFQRTCSSALDTYVWVGSCDPEFQERPDGTFDIKTSEGTMQLQPRWVSEETGEVVNAPLETRELGRILDRVVRLRRLTGMSITEFMAAHAGGTRTAGTEQAQQLDVEPILKGMESRGWTTLALSEAAGLPLNSVLRATRYGYAQVEDVPKLAAAVGLADPNKLLAKEDADQLGLRIDNAQSFLRALKDTHMWSVMLGHSMEGQEVEEVSAIAESLKEYVELLQLDASISKGDVKVAGRPMEPVNQTSVAADVQELLDELATRGIDVLVARNVRFMRFKGQFEQPNDVPMHHSTVFFERRSNLKSAATLT
jgi:hypothetical protein